MRPGKTTGTPACVPPFDDRRGEATENFPARDSAPRMQCGSTVQGTITSRDVLLNTVTIVRLWGPAFYVRCLRIIASGRACTFLEILAGRR
jgi:hypothetical protein